MDKFSVIIPTMWKSEYTEEMLKRYSECDDVGEILLIDNSPSLNKKLNIPKVKQIIQSENIFVNPAWNLGVHTAICNNITIANDDVMFNVNEYYNTLKLIDQQKKIEELGIIGMHSENYNLEKTKDNVELELYNNQTNKGGWGCLFSFSRQNWRYIPDELKIWYGDNWLHFTVKPILQLVGIKVETKMSTTSDLEIVSKVKENDTLEWQKIYKILIYAGFRSA